MRSIDKRLKSNRISINRNYNLYTRLVYFYQSSKIVGYVFILIVPLIISILLDIDWLLISSLSIVSICIAFPMLLLSLVGIKEKYFIVTYENLRTYYLENDEIVFYKPSYIKKGLFAVVVNFVEFTISGFFFVLGIVGVTTLVL